MKTLYWIQPSWKIHIGNYLGGLRKAIEMDSEILIAQYHALTSNSTEWVEENISPLLKTLRKLWVKHISYQMMINTEMAWQIQCITPMSDLRRMTQFKSKEWDCNVGLFTYPCLMAADIILSNCDYVIIGEDQIQHMEFYRRTCERMGIKKVASNIMTDTPRIMSIFDPTKKMSKSLGDKHCLYIWDHEENEKKIKKAPTTPEWIENLKQIAKWLGIIFDENKCWESKKILIQKIENIFNK